MTRQLVDTFEMIDLSLLHFFLGLQVLPMFDGLFLSESKYVLDMLKIFTMDDHKPHVTPFEFGVKLTKGVNLLKLALPFIDN